MSIDAYLSWERSQLGRHEFHRGVAIPRTGGTRQHSLISANLVREFGLLLKGRECQAHGSDMRIHIEASEYFAYPDASVVCPPILGRYPDVISNPVLLAEVLSPSTGDFDRGGKFGHYRRIPSLREYLVFWQDSPRVEHHTRGEGGLWILRECEGRDAVLQLTSLGATLALADVYDKVHVTGWKHYPTRQAGSTIPRDRLEALSHGGVSVRGAIVGTPTIAGRARGVGRRAPSGATRTSGRLESRGGGAA